MRLTDILLLAFRKSYRGSTFRGKHRKYNKVLTKHLNFKIARLNLEEKNMFYLRHPYLTPEQSYGHAAALGNRKEFVDKWRDYRRNRWYPNVPLGDRFGFLKMNDKWE